MKITDILSEDLVLPALAGRSKDDVIEELARAVAERHRDEVDLAKLVQALEDREKLNSTALGEGVAIPHGKLPGLRRVIAAFGRSPGGVDFSSLDGKPTHLFFLLVAPEDCAGAPPEARPGSRRLSAPAPSRPRPGARQQRDLLPGYARARAGARRGRRGGDGGGGVLRSDQRHPAAGGVDRAGRGGGRGRAR